MREYMRVCSKLFIMYNAYLIISFLDSHTIMRLCLANQDKKKIGDYNGFNW